MSWCTWSTSLDGYIRNAPSGTEVHAEHQLRVERSTWWMDQHMQNHTKKNSNQALRLWSGSTDFKTPDYRKINPREYQIVKTHTKETTWIQDPACLATSSTLCRMPHPNYKQNKNTNPIISIQDYNLTQPCPSEVKQTNSAQISPYLKLTQTTEPTSGGQTQKRKKEFNLKAWKRKPQTEWVKKEKSEKAEKHCTNEGTN